jgi:hypothetical protein
VYLCQFLRPERVEVVPSHVRWMKHLGRLYPEASGYYAWMRVASPRLH